MVHVSVVPLGIEPVSANTNSSRDGAYMSAMETPVTKPAQAAFANTRRIGRQRSDRLLAYPR